MTLSRSVLSVPGSSQRFLAKASSSPADVVMVDWEDGVAAEEKATARDLTSAFLTTAEAIRPAVWVRINSHATEHFTGDAAAVNQGQGQSVPLVLPMATIQAAQQVAETIHAAPLIAMLETAEGVEQAAEIARLPRVIGLMFGEYDFLATMAAVGATRLSDTGWAKSRIVNAAAAAGKWAIAGPNADFSDPGSLQKQARREAGLGFAGKLCIHPNQITTVNDEFGPAPEYVAWASDLLQEIGTGTYNGAFRFRGQMIDAPVIARARAAVQLAGATQ